MRAQRLMAWSTKKSVNQQRLDLLEVDVSAKPSTSVWGTTNTAYEFRILSNIGKPCHSWFTCRDYLHDAYRVAFLKGNKVFAPGVTQATHAITPFPTNLICMAVKNMSDSSAKCALKLINHYEDMLGFSHSVHATKKQKTGGAVQVFRGSPKWLKGSGLISFYSFLMRLSKLNDKYGLDKFTTDEELHTIYGNITNVTTGYSTDGSYLRSIKGNLNLVLSLVPKLFKHEWGYAETTNNHHSGGGIVSLCTRRYMNRETNKIISKAIERRMEVGV